MNKQKVLSASLIIILLLISLIFYGLYFILFHGFISTISEIILSLAFIPVQIIFDILVINKIMEKRELLKKEQKINMILGSFYSELGTNLLDVFVKSDSKVEDIRHEALVSMEWTGIEFRNLEEKLRAYECGINIEKINLDKLKEMLNVNRNLLLQLMMSTVTEEDEEFSKLVISVMHLRDELNVRYTDGNLKVYEEDHITKDICTAYRYLTIKWVDYMKHLKSYYKSLFIRALISSPFDNREVEVKDKDYLKI